MKPCRRCGHLFWGRAGEPLCHRCRRPSETFPPTVPDLDAEMQWS